MKQISYKYLNSEKPLEEARKNLNIRTNLINSLQHLLKDPIRNGQLLYQVLQECLIINSEKKINDPPKTLNECRENLLLSLESLSKTPKKFKAHFSKIAESILKGNSTFIDSLIFFISKNRNPRLPNKQIYFDEFLLNFIENQYKPQDYLDYDEENLIEWINELGILNNKINCFEKLWLEIIKGDLLYKIYEKYTGNKVKPVHVAPINDVNILANLRKFLNIFRGKANFPQKFLWAEKEILKGEKASILSFLNDLRNYLEFSYEFSRKNNNKDSIDYKQIKTSLEFSPLFNDKNRNKMHCLFNENKLENKKIIKNESLKKENSVKEEEVIFWLKNLGYFDLVERLEKEDDFWFEFQDGLILSQIIESLEHKSLNINLHPYTKIDCLKNLKEIFSVILQKKGLNLEQILVFDEDLIFEAKKEKIVDVLFNLKKIYEGTQNYLHSISSDSKKKAVNFYDRILRSYILKTKEREKMLIYPKFINDYHY